MSTLHADDPVADVIVDFIAGGVPGNPAGESYGNYNAIFGKPRSSDDLSRRTIGQIYSVVMAGLKARGRPSTATGRYQFLESTLKRLQRELGVPSTAAFTPELQDRLALQLLRHRGYNEWLLNHITDAEFAHRLSMEWASLPDPQNEGRSHYDGIAGNRASCTLAAFVGTLNRAKAQHHRRVIP